MVWYNYLLFKVKKILKSECEFFEKKSVLNNLKKDEFCIRIKSKIEACIIKL